MLKKLFLFIIPFGIFAYENIALHKSAWQLHPYEYKTFKDILNASKAVDGLKTNLSFSGQQCTQSANYKYEALWRVDLGDILGIHSITIYYRTDNAPWGPNHGYVGRFLGFSVYVSNTTKIKDGVLCFKDDYFTKFTIPAVITLNCTHHGRYVIYYNNRTSNSKPHDYSEYAFNELCEFEVFGCPAPDHFGENCSLSCPVYCNNSLCHIETGHCFACEDGYEGPMCEQPCLNNTYGTGCLEICGQCLSKQQCNHINGTCTNGCETGFYSDRCKRECPAGKYGNNCLQICSENCYIAKTCDRKTGVCHKGCAVGWKLPFCNEECDGGTFGTNCSSNCGHCFQGQSCDVETGVCPKGCDSGYDGMYCNKTCAETYYGPNCNLTCSTSCVNKTCDSRSGKCLTASQEKEIIEETSSAPSIGGSFGVILVVIAVAVIIIYRKKNINTCRCIIPGKHISKSSNTSSENTSHMPKTYMDLKESQYNEIGENVYDNIETELPLENKNVYEQLVADISLNEIGFVISNKGKDNADGFKKELASITRGEQFSCETGKLSVNSEKNRVHSSLPYDHSRVILRRNVGTSDDYINANYISGAERKNEYIATQGPLKTTTVEFWEMVCQDQIQQIIMLTNLSEQKEVKCCQYWPMDGMIEYYGTVSVKSIEEKSYAFFTKRKLEVSQTGIKTCEVTQFHYTMWPEHGTPDPLCFVIFHHHVMHENINNGISPILVHCSTGAGRTGAFIALDYLYKTGKLSGRVNVAEYVKTMRKNRMNMIENYRQYKAVFLALHEAFKAEPVLQTKEEFLDTVSPMLKKAAATSYVKREFELLKRICQVYADEDCKQVDKYEHYRPSNVPRRGLFINALFVSTHIKENGFIITQYPPPEEAVDFLRLLIDHECSTIICLDPLHIIDSTKSWMPSLSSEKIVPPYRVVRNSCKETDLKLSTISIQKDNGQPFNVLVAEPKSDLGSRTQNDTSTLCGLASFALSRPSNTTIAVVSRDGASLCGVFCAVFNSIQQITMDDNIDVFTTVRLLMTRRLELCSTEDEYRMTYQTIYDYLQRPSQNVYCNQ